MMMKRQRWEQVSEVDGVPTTMHMSMEDLQAKTRTDVDVPDALFDPVSLPSAPTSPVWARPGGWTF